MWRATALLSLGTLAACSDANGCAGSAEPLPAGGLPAAQTVEGGGQVLLSAAAIDKLVADAQADVEATLANGACMPPGQVGTPSGGFLATGARYCHTNQGALPQIPDACGAENGCNVGLHLDSITVASSGDGGVVGTVVVDTSANVPMSGQVVGIGFSCGATLAQADASVTSEFRFAIDAAGVVEVEPVTHSIAGAPDLTGCSIVNDVAGLYAALIGDHAAAVGAAVTSALVDAADGYLAAPAEGRLAITAFVDDASAEPNYLELSAVGGGTATSAAGGLGLGLGVNLGANSDADPVTRAPGQASEPAACVAGLAPPDLSMLAALTATDHGTYLLPASGAIALDPAPARDVTLGLAEPALDLVAHHVTASGALCLDTDAARFTQLSLGNLSVLVPSLGTVGTGQEPLRVTVRPGAGLDASITATPELALRLDDLVLEVFATLDGSETSLLSLRVSAEWTSDLAVLEPTTQRASVEPLVGGFVAQAPELLTANDALITETAEELGAVLPSVVALLLPSLTPEFRYAIPDVAGRAAHNVTLARLTTDGADYLAAEADLAPPPDESVAPDGGAFAASVLEVDVPPPAEVRAALAGDAGASLPTVTVEVEAADAMDRPLEWRWKLGGGLWRGRSTAAPLVVREPALAWQGRHTVTVSARAAGTHEAWSTPVDLEVVIDSLGPRIFDADAAWADDVLTFTGLDAVFGTEGLEWGFGPDGADAPTTAWSAAATITRADADALASSGDAFTVFARDPRGNQTAVRFAHVPPEPPVDGVPPDAMPGPDGGSPGDGGAGGGCCGVGADARSSSALGLLIGLLALRRRPRRYRRTPDQRAG